MMRIQALCTHWKHLHETARQQHARTATRDLLIGATVCLSLWGLIGCLGLRLLLYGWPHVQRNESPAFPGAVILGVAVVGVGVTLWLLLPVVRGVGREATTKEPS